MKRQVGRDDLLDGGAEHAGRTVERLRELRGDILIEVLAGDFAGRLESVDTVCEAGLDVFAHNIETVERLQRTVRDVRSSYARSLEILGRAKRAQAARQQAGERPLLTKSSIMVGLGETDDEVVAAMRDLREAGVEIVTLGQYLRPSQKHHEVKRFVEPERFAEYELEAQRMGFLYCASGPLVRSSYKAAEVFLRSLLGDSPEVERSLSERLAEARLAAERVAAAHPENTRLPGAVSARPDGQDTFIPAASLVRSK